MKASTIVRNVAKEYYGSGYRLFNDRLGKNSKHRNIKVQVGWGNPQLYTKGPTPSVEFFRECLARLRAAGYGVKMNPREYRFWVYT